MFYATNYAKFAFVVKWVFLGWVGAKWYLLKYLKLLRHTSMNTAYVTYYSNEKSLLLACVLYEPRYYYLYTKIYDTACCAAVISDALVR